MFEFYDGYRQHTINFWNKKEKQYSDCPYCSYQGCIWKREKYPVIGHWLFTIELLFRSIKSRINKFIYDLGALDYSQLEDIEVDGIDHSDYPDFCDAYISNATYKGRQITESELKRLNEDSSFIHKLVMERIY